MSIGRIDFQGAIIRTGDYSAVKQNEDNKPQTDQAAFQVLFSREADEKSQSVSHTSKSDPQKFKFDAKEKGNGSYESPDGDHKKKKDKPLKELHPKSSVLVGKDGRQIEPSPKPTYDFKI